MSEAIAHLELMARYGAAIEEAEKGARPMRRQRTTSILLERAEARTRAVEEGLCRAERKLQELIEGGPRNRALSLYADGVSTWWIARLLNLPRAKVREMVRGG